MRMCLAFAPPASDGLRNNKSVELRRKRVFGGLLRAPLPLKLKRGFCCIRPRPTGRRLDLFHPRRPFTFVFRAVKHFGTVGKLIGDVSHAPYDFFDRRMTRSRAMPLVLPGKGTSHAKATDIRTNTE